MSNPRITWLTGHARRLAADPEALGVFVADMRREHSDPAIVALLDRLEMAADDDAVRQVCDETDKANGGAA